jgi:hypothetical protein
VCRIVGVCLIGGWLAGLAYSAPRGIVEHHGRTWWSLDQQRKMPRDEFQMDPRTAEGRRLQERWLVGVRWNRRSEDDIFWGMHPADHGGFDGY